MWKLFACLAFLIVAVTAQTLTVTLDDETYDVDTWSDWIYVETSTIPNTTFDVTIQAWNRSDATSAPLTIEPNTLTFGPTTQVQVFRVSHNVVGNFFLNFTKGDDGGQFADLADQDINFVYRRFTFLQWPPAPLVAGLPSEPLSIIVSSAPARQLRLTPVCNDTTIRFLGPAIINAGTLSGTFFVEGLSQATSFPADVTWTLEGDDEGYYFRDALDGIVNFVINPRQITITSDPSVNIQLGSVNSTGINVFLRDRANDSLTVTPQAANTVFTPSSFTFSGDTTEAFFTFSSSVPNSDSAVAKNVRFYTSGASRYLYTLDPAAVTYNAPKRQVNVNIGTQYVVTNRTYMSLSISAPVKTSLVVSFTASNVKFNVSSVEFKNNITSFAVEITNTYIGADNIYFAISGADATEGLFDEIAPAGISAIVPGNFIGPNAWYIPKLWVGVESDRIPIRASISPRNSVTITPVAANLIFRPSSLTFRNGTEQQYFTITPLYNTDDTTYTAQVRWFINGTDHIMFSLPSSFAVTVSGRTFQATHSAHLKTAEIDGPHTDDTRYLHKTYKIWTSVNYIGKNEHFSVTPTSPFYSFKPSVLFFNNKNTRIELEATVTGIPPTGTMGRIDYVYGGQDGGLYIPATPDSKTLALRPLIIAAAVVAPDERSSKGVYLYRNVTGPTYPVTRPYDPVSAGALRAYHVYSFKIRSFVLPDKSLTITPRCAHATFSPSKITIKGDDGVKQQNYWPTVQDNNFIYLFNVSGVYLEANFSVKAQAAGTHDVWFELSGEDKDFYARIPHTPMTFNLVMRPDSEPYRVSSSSFLLPSFVVVAAMAVLSLVM